MQTPIAYAVSYVYISQTRLKSARTDKLVTFNHGHAVKHLVTTKQILARYIHVKRNIHVGLKL